MPQRPEKVLLVEDDKDLARLMSNVLTAEGYGVDVAHTFNAGKKLAQTKAPALVLLDVMLPGGDGYALCRAIRPHVDGPILMVTARGSSFDEVMGLDSGADDYLVKPVAPEVLLARIRTHLRRERGRFAQVASVGPFRVSSRERTVTCDGVPIGLSTAEFDTFWELARQAGHVVSRDALSMALRGIPYNGTDRTVDLRVSRLRQKLKPFWPGGEFIKTVHGEGYLLVDVDDA